MLLASPIEALQHYLNKYRTESFSTDYQKWRDRFMLERLHLTLWIALIAVPAFLMLNLAIAATYNATGNLDKNFTPETITLWVMQFTAIELCIILCLTLIRIPWARRYPALLFLGFSWSLTLLTQIQATLRGETEVDDLTWILVFLAQATLIPVRWRLHLISQLGVLGYFFFMNIVVGLYDPRVAEHRTLTLVLIAFVQTWLCFICDLGVYLYQRLQQEEFESRQQVRVFLHAVSHDLRNPVLGTVMVLRNLLNQSGEKIQISRAVLERIVDSSNRQLDLINSLIEAHATEVRGFVVHCQPIHLSALVKSVVADVQPAIAQDRAHLIHQIPDTLPLVNADPLQLGRVYQNLIVNALKHNPPGLTITLKATHEGDWIRCTVADDGAGLSPEQSAKLFDLYFRGTQRRQSVGLGLGLYLCRQIITAHGGEIGVNSCLGTGATFWFTLPVAVSPSPKG